MDSPLNFIKSRVCPLNKRHRHWERKNLCIQYIISAPSVIIIKEKIEDGGERISSKE